MAVAALSTASILTPASPAPAAAQQPAAGETTERFATLVSRAKPDDKAAAEHGKSETGEESAAEGELAQDDSAQAGTTTEPVTAPIEQSADLLARIQAMATAAAQLFVAQPAPADATPTPTIVSTDATATAGTTIVTTPAPTPIGLFQPAIATTEAVETGKTGEASEATPPALPTEASAAPAKPLTARSDIAALIASLKSAFEQGEAKPAADPAAVIAATSPTDADPAIVTAPQPAVVQPIAIETEAQAAAKPQTALGAIVAQLSQRSPATTERPPVAADSADQDESGLTISGVAVPDDSAAAAAAPAAPTTPHAPIAATTAPTQPVTASTDAAAVADMSAAGSAEQVIDRHIDLARDQQWLDRLARDISQAANTQGSLKFHLNPEHLGSLAIEIANSASGTAIKFTTETDQARAIIADAQPRLLAEVRAQGLRVSESHVDLNQQQNGGTGSSHTAAGQGQAQQQNRHASEDHKPFARTQASIRDDAGDSASRDDGELYA